MKKILITQRLEKIDKINEIRNSLDVRWRELLQSINLIPIPLPLNANIDYYMHLNISGMILTGGNDLFSQSNNELSKLRDIHEKKCINYAIEKSIPIIGICRGMQIIAEYFGSTLKKVNNHVSSRHKFSVCKKNRFSDLFSNVNEVNSFHHYGIEKLGKELDIIGRAPEDGQIEAISHNKHKIIAYMGHPERETPFNTDQCKIISTFFDS